MHLVSHVRKLNFKLLIVENLLQKMKFINFLLCLRAIFALLDPDTDPDPQHGFADPSGSVLSILGYDFLPGTGGRGTR